MIGIVVCGLAMLALLMIFLLGLYVLWTDIVEDLDNE